MAISAKKCNFTKIKKNFGESLNFSAKFTIFVL